MSVNLLDIGAAASLRPDTSQGWFPVFASGVLDGLPPAGTPASAERQGFDYTVIGGNTFPWNQQLSPTDVYNKLRAQGKRVYCVEVWENPPSWGFAGVDSFIYIAVYS